MQLVLFAACLTVAGYGQHFYIEGRLLPTILAFLGAVALLEVMAYLLLTRDRSKTNAGELAFALLLIIPVAQFIFLAILPGYPWWMIALSVILQGFFTSIIFVAIHALDETRMVMPPALRATLLVLSLLLPAIGAIIAGQPHLLP
jgi:hypothetical protein